MTDRDEALALAREAGFIPNFSTFICDEEDIARLIALARRELQAENEALRKDRELIAWLTDRGELYFDRIDALRDSDGFIEPLYKLGKKA